MKMKGTVSMKENRGSSVSNVVSRYLADRKIESITLPTIDRSRIKITRSPDVFRKVFKRTLLAPVENDSGFAARMSECFTSKMGISDQKSFAEMSSVCYQTRLLQKRFEDLKTRYSEFKETKNSLKHSKENLKTSQVPITPSSEFREIRSLRLGMKLTISEMVKENELLNKILEKEQRDIEDLREKVERLKEKTRILEDFANGQEENKSV